MKKFLICLMLVLLCTSAARAEETARQTLDHAGIGSIYSFAREYGVEDILEKASDTALTGAFESNESIIRWIKKQLAEPALRMAGVARTMLVPTLMLALLRACMPRSSGACEGACFLLRLILMLGASDLAEEALKSAQYSIEAACDFTDAAAPVMSALLTAMGMNSSAALASPSAALAGGAAESLFLNCGLPLCRFGLCTAIAGNLSSVIDLSRITGLLKKAANWGSGLALTLFTALLAVQGSVAEGLDGVGMRTAKFAVDSAAPIIGSGVSDAWESYVSGVMIAKNALGVSGIAALLAVGIQPLASCLSAMLILNILGAILGMLGEKQAGSAAAQIGGICQMALSLSTGALAIATVLLGAIMAAGKGLIS